MPENTFELKTKTINQNEKKKKKFSFRKIKKLTKLFAR